MDMEGQKEIRFSMDTLYHCLTHFSSISEEAVEVLQQAGYSLEQIEEQLAKPGSKFSSSFGMSPMQVLDRLGVRCPEVLKNLPEPDPDGRIRLSFAMDQTIGTDGVVDVRTLSEDELSAMRTESRNGCLIRKVRISRKVPTCECQMVLAEGDDCLHVITLYPGVKAPPLPRNGEPDPFWDNHCFIEY